jgi:Fe-S cluster assembly protein SufD
MRDMNILDHYSNLSSTIRSTPSNNRLGKLQQAAMQHLLSYGFPTQKHEEWRYTDLSALSEQPFLAAESASLTDSDLILIRSKRLESAVNFVFINGFFDSGLSDQAPTELEICSIDSAIENAPELIDTYLGQKPSFRDGVDALAQSSFRDGLMVRVLKNAQPERPLHFIHFSGSADRLSSLQHFIVLEEHSSATLIQSFVGNNSRYLSFSSTNIYAQHASALTLTNVEKEGSQALHFNTINVKLDSSSELKMDLLMIGAKTARTRLDVRLEAEALFELNGLFLSGGHRISDVHTTVNHVGAHSKSQQKIRGIALDKGRGVFSGKIIVSPGAQKADASMSNQNLLLSDLAEIDSKPQLEIHADDVKCSHGVTVGQLDDEAIFFLQSRGIDRASAHKLLTFAFANRLIEEISQEELKKQVSKSVTDVLSFAEQNETR